MNVHIKTFIIQSIYENAYHVLHPERYVLERFIHHILSLAVHMCEGVSHLAPTNEQCEVCSLTDFTSQ